MTGCDFTNVQLTTIKESIRNIVTIVSNSAGLADSSQLINEAMQNLDRINGILDSENAQVTNCINEIKENFKQPKKKYDDINTSYAMLANSQVFHKEIIYSRIQIIIYIIALIYFFKTVISK